MSKKGIFKDPWRFGIQAPEAPKPSPRRPAPAPASDYVRPSGDTDEEAQAAIQRVEYPNYGGIAVKGAEQSSSIAAAVLQFCINKRDVIDDLLTEHGLLLAKLSPGTLDIPFYITRTDGWTLTVPEATTRMQGLLCLIQCLLSADTVPSLRKELKNLGIRPYRV